MAGENGGAGIRTPVRTTIRNYLYVHRLRLRSPMDGTQPAGRRTSPLKISPTARRHHGQPARIIDTPGDGSNNHRPEQVLQALSLSSQCHFIVGNYNFPVGIYQRTGNPGHAAITSQSPSKPVAPHHLRKIARPLRWSTAQADSTRFRPRSLAL
jgi:hypothetical protein